MKRMCVCGCGREFDLRGHNRIYFNERTCGHSYRRRHSIRVCAAIVDPQRVAPLPDFATVLRREDWTDDWNKTRTMATTGDVEVLMGAGR